MCAECEYLATSHILDYVNLGLHLEVAIKLERDAVIQHAIHDRVGEDALQAALDLSKTVTETGERLKLVAMLPDTWARLLASRAADAEAET